MCDEPDEDNITLVESIKDSSVVEAFAEVIRLDPHPTG